jgi:hypothetical protein
MSEAGAEGRARVLQTGRRQRAGQIALRTRP